VQIITRVTRSQILTRAIGSGFPRLDFRCILFTKENP